MQVSRAIATINARLFNQVFHCWKLHQHNLIKIASHENHAEEASIRGEAQLLLTREN
ncbi:UNVERIFIED_CONTAM: hypothetical protein FKN15_059688 [Acipenser sinensis]